MLQPVRKPALLRQTFAICLGHPAEILSLQKIAGRMTGAGNLATIADYLSLLGEAYLAVALPKFARTEVRRRATPPKLMTLSNACIARAVNDGYRVTYWREESQEVDLVVDGDAGKWVIEVKGGDYTLRELTALLEFRRRNPEYRPLLIGDDAYRDIAGKAGIAFLSWQNYLLDGLAVLHGREW